MVQMTRIIQPMMERVIGIQLQMAIIIGQNIRNCGFGQWAVLDIQKMAVVLM